MLAAAQGVLPSATVNLHFVVHLALRFATYTRALHALHALNMYECAHKTYS